MSRGLNNAFLPRERISCRKPTIFGRNLREQPGVVKPGSRFELTDLSAGVLRPGAPTLVVEHDAVQIETLGRRRPSESRAIFLD